MGLSQSQFQSVYYLTDLPSPYKNRYCDKHGNLKIDEEENGDYIKACPCKKYKQESKAAISSSTTWIDKCVLMLWEDHKNFNKDRILDSVYILESAKLKDIERPVITFAYKIDPNYKYALNFWLEWKNVIIQLQHKFLYWVYINEILIDGGDSLDFMHKTTPPSKEGTLKTNMVRFKGNTSYFNIYIKIKYLPEDIELPLKEE